MSNSPGDYPNDKTAENPSRRAGHRILVVDDEESILSSIRRLLRRESYDVVVARSADEGFAAMQANPAEVVLSDYRMPEKKGTEFLREVQQHWPDTIRIIISGYSEVRAIIDAINEGAIYKYISKPWNDEELLLHIRRAIEQHELISENRRMATEIASQNDQLREFNEQLSERAEDACAGLSLTQELFEVLTAGIVVVDPNGLCVMANAAARRVMGVDLAGAIGMPARAVMHEMLFEDVNRCLRKPESKVAGHLQGGGARLQWRCDALNMDGQTRGVVVVIWEDVR